MYVRADAIQSEWILEFARAQGLTVKPRQTDTVRTADAALSGEGEAIDSCPVEFDQQSPLPQQGVEGRYVVCRSTGLI